MKISTLGLDFIRQWEMLRLVPYQDVAGHLTVGWGHRLPKGSSLLSIPLVEAEDFFIDDVAAAEDAVRRAITVKVTQAQWDALVSFTFNVGAGHLNSSTLRKLLNAKDHLGAAAEFPKWHRAGGKRSKGLLRRRLEEAKMFLA